MRKKIIYGFIAFLATLIGGVALKKKQQKTATFDPTQYHGVWTFLDKNQQSHQLCISPKFDLSINDHSLGTTLIELNDKQLIVRDQYGFYLTFSYEEMTFHDESNDSSYLVKKTGKRKTN